MPIRGLIFDYGGVLWDMSFPAARALEQEHGLAERLIAETLYGTPLWREVQIGGGDRDRWIAEAHELLETRAGRPLPPLHQHWREQQRWITPNIELIRRLRPGYRTAILSNADQTLRTRIMESDTGVLDLFDEFICSAEVQMAKPEPGIYRLAAERLGLPPADCVFVDDVERNVAAARAVGMEGVVFRIDEDDSLEEQLAALGVRADASANDARRA
jgi:putative hydrolase of the HAD superfamily